MGNSVFRLERRFFCHVIANVTKTFKSLVNV
jgi:hypothetical protein